MKYKFLLLLWFVTFLGLAQSNSLIPEKQGWKINTRQNSTEKTLVVINEIYFVNGQYIQNLDSKNIESVNVVKGEKSLQKYGENGKNGVIEIKTKNYSKTELDNFAKLYAFEYSNNTGKSFVIYGNVTDCEEMALNRVDVINLNSKNRTETDSLGNFSIETKKNDVLLFHKIGLESKRLLIKNRKNIAVSLKESPPEKGIFYKKPVIYLYPTEKKDITIQIECNGILQTTFPKYNNKWVVTAEPNGQIFDKNTQRYYNSLFWDASVDLPKEEYLYETGFVVEKEKLTSFLIEKLEFIGLNQQETNDFIQFWLPILEQNRYNFIHFRVNEECNAIAKLKISPKPDSSIRIYMEFYGLNQFISVKEQLLKTSERKNFTIVEWGGSDVSGKIPNNNL